MANKPMSRKDGTGTGEFPAMGITTVLSRGWNQFLDGMGLRITLDPGNRGNPPGDPPVVTGTYQFIPEYAMQGRGHVATDFAPIPTDFRDWGQYAVNVSDPSGQTGGGYSMDPQVSMPTETSLYFDPTTGLYYDLGSMS